MAESKKTTRKAADTTGSINAVVFVPSGPTPRDTILKTAISAVRDNIPVVYTLNPEIDSVSDIKTVEGVQGREYTVKVNYDATGVEGAEPVDLDREVEKLTVPTLTDYQSVTTGGPVGPSDGPGDK